jgi:hypothetical protein
MSDTAASADDFRQTGGGVPRSTAMDHGKLTMLENRRSFDLDESQNVSDGGWESSRSDRDSGVET